MPPRGVHRHHGVQQGDQRQAGRPQRREPVQPEHGQVGQRHQGPAGQARAGRQRGRGAYRAGCEPDGREPDDGPGRRHEVDQGQPGHGPGQQPGRVPELDVGGPGHHLPQVGEPGVGAHADHRGRQPEPAAPALALDDLAQGHVVDAGAADRGQPAGSLEGLPAHQHAAAGRRCGAGPGRVHPAERVQLGEEVHERGDHDPLPRGGRAQQRHLRDQVPVVGFGRADQGPQRARPPGDVGVGEQHVSPGSVIAGPSQAVRQAVRQALGHGPHLAGPAGRQRGAGHHPQGPPRAARFRPEGGRDLRGAVRAAVVDQDDGQRAGVVLAEQRRQHGRQHRGLVAGRDDGHHVRPPVRRVRAPVRRVRAPVRRVRAPVRRVRAPVRRVRAPVRPGRGAGRREALAGPPVPAVPEDQVGPDGRGRRARDTQRQHPGSLSQPRRDPAC